jgi:hypothetical protein
MQPHAAGLKTGISGNSKASFSWYAIKIVSDSFQRLKNEVFVVGYITPLACLIKQSPPKNPPEGGT